MNITIYHNTRCSKSRSTLQIIENKGIKPTIINYQESPPSKEDLKKILKSLQKTPQEIIRFNEKLAKKINLFPND
jgi:arsenate reductase